MTGAANGNGRQPDDPGATPGNGKGRKVWLDVRILLHCATLASLAIMGLWNYFGIHADQKLLRAEVKAEVGGVKTEVGTLSKRVSALSAADTRRGNQIADKIVAAISELRTAVQVLSANSNRFEAEVRRELDELRRDVRLQRGREGP